MSFLRLTSVSVSVGGRTLLDSIDALVVKGERIGLYGPNGCGKSTGPISQNDENYWTVTIDGRVSSTERGQGSVLLVDQDILSWSDLFHGMVSEGDLREMTMQEALDVAITEGLATHSMMRRHGGISL